MRHATSTATALALALGLASAPGWAQSDGAREPTSSAAVTGCVQAGAQVSAEAFAALDDNGDGFISRDEYVENCGKASAAAEDVAAQAHFAALDRDNDKKLTPEEFKAPAMQRGDGAAASAAEPSAGAAAGPSSAARMGAGAAPGERREQSLAALPGGAGQTAEQPRADAMAGLRAADFIGQELVNANGDEVGKIKDVVVDRQQVVHAIVSVGGFLGLGAKQIAVPFDDLRIGQDKILLMSAANEADLKRLPAYEKDAYAPIPRQAAGTAGKTE